MYNLFMVDVKRQLYLFPAKGNHVLWFNTPFLTPGSLQFYSQWVEGKQTVAPRENSLTGGRWRFGKSLATRILVRNKIFQILNDCCNLFLALIGDFFSPNWTWKLYVHSAMELLYCQLVLKSTFKMPPQGTGKWNFIWFLHYNWTCVLKGDLLMQFRNV